MTEPLPETTEDAFLGGSLRLRQPKSGHRAGHDAMLLAAATTARSGDRVVDFGAGVGAAGLAVARRVAGIKIALVEIDAALAALARGNAASNAIEAKVIAIDIASGAESLAAAGLAVARRVAGIKIALVEKRVLGRLRERIGHRAAVRAQGRRR